MRNCHTEELLSLGHRGVRIWAGRREACVKSGGAQWVRRSLPGPLEVGASYEPGEGTGLAGEEGSMRDIQASDYRDPQNLLVERGLDAEDGRES